MERNAINVTHPEQGFEIKNAGGDIDRQQHFGCTASQQRFQALYFV
jgi:hypothetical protein